MRFDTMLTGRKYYLLQVAISCLCLPGVVQARLNVPDLPAIDGVDVAAGPMAALEGIVVYFVYLLASLFVVWVVLSVGRRVISEFNDARRDSGDFGRVIVTAFVGMGVTLFIIFLANYLTDMIS